MSIGDYIPGKGWVDDPEPIEVQNIAPIRHNPKCEDRRLSYDPKTGSWGSMPEITTSWYDTKDEVWRLPDGRVDHRDEETQELLKKAQRLAAEAMAIRGYRCGPDGRRV